MRAVFLLLFLIVISFSLVQVVAQEQYRLAFTPAPPSGGECRLWAKDYVIAYKGETEVYLWWSNRDYDEYYLVLYETYPDGSTHRYPPSGVFGPYPRLPQDVALVGGFYGDVPGSHYLYFQLFGPSGNLLCTSNTIKIDVIRVKQASSISISVYPSSTRVGESITISGSISPAPGTSSQVTLTIRTPSEERKVEVTSDQSGHYSYTLSPDSTGTWYVQASWPGNEDYVGATSNWARFTVEVRAYYVTIETDPPGLSFKVDGATYSGRATFKWEEGSSHVVEVQKEIAKGDERYVFTKWSDEYTGSVRMIIVTGPGHYVAKFSVIKAYSVTVETMPSLNFLVDGVRCSGRATFKWEEGSSHTIAVEKEIYLGSGERYLFTGWNDGSTDNVRTVNVRGPAHYVASFKHQYYFLVESDYGVVSGSGWYDEGSTVRAEIDRKDVPGFPYSWVFRGWGGDAKGADLVSDPILMDGPKVAKAVWERTISPLVYVLVGAFVAAVAIIAAVIYRRRRIAPGGTAVREAGTAIREKPVELETKLMEIGETDVIDPNVIKEHLKRLEELHREGKISEEVYRKLKEEYEEKLRKWR